MADLSYPDDAPVEVDLQTAFFEFVVTAACLGGLFLLRRRPGASTKWFRLGLALPALSSGVAIVYFGRYAADERWEAAVVRLTVLTWRVGVPAFAPALAIQHGVRGLRSAAPVLAYEDALAVFESVPRSPYMSFAPRLTPAAAAALPGIRHFDGTARPQVVAPDDEPWLHALLLAVKRRTGWAVLINTSFNTKGSPILNTAAEVLDLLRDSPDLDAVLRPNRRALSPTATHAGMAVAERDRAG